MASTDGSGEEAVASSVDKIEHKGDEGDSAEGKEVITVDLAAVPKEVFFNSFSLKVF